MNIKEDLEAFVHFFNEIIAHVLPGFLFLLAFELIFLEKITYIKEIHWSIVVGLSFIAGHILLGLNRLIEKKFSDSEEDILSGYRAIDEFKKYLFVYAKTPDDNSSINFSEDLHVLDYRNIAMTVSAEQRFRGVQRP